MKNMYRTLTGISMICLTLAACQPTLTDAQRDAIEKELLEFTDHIIKLFNDKDTAAIYTYYADDFTAYSRGTLIVKDPEEWAAYKERAKIGMADGNFEYKVEDPRVEVFTRDVANICYTYTRTDRYSDAITLRTRSASTWTMVKQNGEWKIKHAHLSSGKDRCRAVEGDTVWVFLNRVSADKKESFEQFVHDVMYSKMIEAEGLDGAVARMTRFLHPADANEDGTYTYVFIMDPVISGFNYGIRNVMSRYYSEDEIDEKIKMFTDAMVGPQTLIPLIQSEY